MRPLVVGDILEFKEAWQIWSASAGDRLEVVNVVLGMNGPGYWLLRLPRDPARVPFYFEQDQLDDYFALVSLPPVGPAPRRRWACGHKREDGPVCCPVCAAFPGRPRVEE